MNRQEATDILRELIRECEGLLSVRGVSLSRVDKESGDYELHIACRLDEELRRSMHSILSRHNLAMKENVREVVVFGPKTEL